jgi:hypothetical protein
LHWIPEVREPKVVERVARRLIAFAWPGGASHVHLGVIAPDRGDVEWTDLTIDHESFVKGEAWQFPDDNTQRVAQLTLRGSIITGRGQQVQHVYGRQSVAFDYVGLNIIKYWIEPVPGKPWVKVTLWADAQIRGRRLSFALVGGPFLPLAREPGRPAAGGITPDGDRRDDRLTVEGLGQERREGWFDLSTLRPDSRYIRLVLEEPAGAADRSLRPNVALLDPPVNQLALHHR